MRLAWWMTALGLALAIGCGGGSSNAPSGEGDGDEASDEDRDAGEGDAPKRKPMERPVSDQGKSWGGWRWKGKGEDCFYVHHNQCFATLEAACKAAKCKTADCSADEGAPAKVSCDR